MGRENLEEWDVEVGRVQGTWDRALLRFRPFTENHEYFAVGGELVVLKPEPRKLVIRASQRKNHDFVCDVGLVTAADAAIFVGQQLFVHPEMRPDLEDDGHYIDELLGLRVITDRGDDLGEIEEVIETAAHDVYVTPHAMIPAVPEYILELDWDKELVTVRDVPGLRTDDDAETARSKPETSAEIGDDVEASSENIDAEVPSDESSNNEASSGEATRNA
jgi:16S rRNA processing protein RimM